MAAVDVVIAATPRQWATRLTEWITDHGEQARLRDHYIFDRADAFEHDYDCLVVDAESSLLDAALVQQLRRRERTVVGVADREAPEGAQRLHDLGVEWVLDVADSAQAMVAMIIEAAAADRRFRATVTDLEDLADPTDRQGEPADDNAPARHARPGSVLTVVAGALEGVGATEVAVETAAALRARGQSAVLVDADLVAPSLAQRLQTPLTANLFAAVDAVAHRLGDLSGALSTVKRGGFALLGGSSTPSTGSTWISMTCSRCSRRCAHRTSRWSWRSARSSRRCRAAATSWPACWSARPTACCLVIEASPTGLVRASRWMVDATELTQPGRVHLVRNRSDRRDARPPVEAELWRTVACAGVHHLPTDRKVVAAHWAGELTPAGRFTKAIAATANAAIPTTALARTPAEAAR